MTRYVKPSSINAQIRDTEQQILNHQRAINSRAKVLTGKLQQQIIIKPATLLLAVGIGFILGELTQCHRGSIANKPQAGETSPLKIALNLLATARTLYAALPLILMIRSRYQSSTSEQKTRASDAKTTKASP
jgi:hypothetical protein